MADQTVRLENPEGKYRVAFDIAQMLWRESNEFNNPTMNDKDQFLDLVQACIKSLNGSAPRQI